MAKLIRLTDRLDVAADQVAEVTTIEHKDGLQVRMKDGRVHWVPNDYGKSEWDTKRRLVAVINEALSGGQEQ